MNILSLGKIFRLVLYYGLLKHLPASTNFGGILWRKLRYHCCKGLFKKCGKNVNIEHGAVFGIGTKIEIGDNSGIGINCVIPSDTIIGSNVMMGPKCYILSLNHMYNRVDIPIMQQGNTERKQTIIEDDCWIGMRCFFTPGRHLRRGTIVAMCSVLTKDFPEYSIVGGNPAKLIKSRMSNKSNNSNKP